MQKWSKLKRLGEDEQKALTGFVYGWPTTDVDLPGETTRRRSRSGDSFERRGGLQRVIISGQLQQQPTALCSFLFPLFFFTFFTCAHRVPLNPPLPLHDVDVKDAIFFFFFYPTKQSLNKIKCSPRLRVTFNESLVNYSRIKRLRWTSIHWPNLLTFFYSITRII